MSLRPRALLAAIAALPLALAGSLAAAAHADGDGTTSVLVPVSNCDTTGSGPHCFAEHLVHKRVPTARAHEYLRSLAALNGAGPAGGYSPGQVAKAYGISAGSSAASKQVVAIVDAYNAPNALSHLDTFDEQYGLPDETNDSFRVVGQDGSSTLPTQYDEGWAGEVDLDLQAVRGMCHACKILLVEADPSYDALGEAVDSAAAYSWSGNDTTTPLKVKIISNSYGGNATADLESGYAGYYDHPGKAVLVSSGDDGWLNWDAVNSNNPPPGLANFPATASSVVAVGGTALTLKSNGARNTETVWNDDGGHDANGYVKDVAGSGCSRTITAKTFQSKVAGYSALGCGKKRSSVDIAALAAPSTGYDVYSTYNNTARWLTYGGTSLSSPLVAGMWAIAGGPGSTAYPAQNLYKHFAAKKNRGLYDVTSGGNGFCGPEGTTTCQTNVGVDPNTVLGDVDCQFAWETHAAGSTKFQCRPRKGFDGVSGVGAPTGTAVFKP